MLPFFRFLPPHVGADSKGSDDQHLTHIEVIEHQVKDGGQRDNCFAQTHREKNRA
ncbi:hypothetical protein SDC9_145675 [bioreactor metagenome]|uniref:Uncharacterized protein n=1 Tax=bioreactor metagenome TaxID=1076179 RepID=A0A645E991_9ZZZZ